MAASNASEKPNNSITIPHPKTLVVALFKGVKSLLTPSKTSGKPGSALPSVGGLFGLVGTAVKKLARLITMCVLSLFVLALLIVMLEWSLEVIYFAVYNLFDIDLYSVADSLLSAADRAVAEAAALDLPTAVTDVPVVSDIPPVN